MTDYVGKKLSECPEGTVAVVADLDGLQHVRQHRNDLAWDYGDDEPEPFGSASHYTVVQVLKLGEDRPKTLADEEPGVAWRNERGRLIWRNETISVMCCDPGGIPGLAPLTADHYAIQDTWTRVGRVRIEVKGD